MNSSIYKGMTKVSKEEFDHVLASCDYEASSWANGTVYSQKKSQYPDPKDIAFRLDFGKDQNPSTEYYVAKKPSIQAEEPSGDARELNVLRQAAMSLLAMVSAHHAIECTCGHCQRAVNAVFYLPKMKQSAVEEFKKRREIQIKAEKERLRINPGLN